MEGLPWGIIIGVIVVIGVLIAFGFGLNYVIEDVKAAAKVMTTSEAIFWGLIAIALVLLIKD